MFRREECVVAPLSEESTRRWRIVRLIGAVAALLVAIGGWGGGAVMTQNPITSVPVINLLSRAPFSSVGLCLIGTSVIVVAWLTMMRYAPPPEGGMTLTVEPMLTLGDQSNHQWDDGWTVLTNDGSRCAQFEQTLVVEKDGARILTTLE